MFIILTNYISFHLLKGTPIAVPFFPDKFEQNGIYFSKHLIREGNMACIMYINWENKNVFTISIFPIMERFPCSHNLISRTIVSILSFQLSSNWLAGILLLNCTPRIFIVSLSPFSQVIWSHRWVGLVLPTHIASIFCILRCNPLKLLKSSNTVKVSITS